MKTYNEGALVPKMVLMCTLIVEKACSLCNFVIQRLTPITLEKREFKSSEGYLPLRGGCMMIDWNCAA